MGIGSSFGSKGAQKGDEACGTSLAGWANDTQLQGMETVKPSSRVGEAFKNH